MLESAGKEVAAQQDHFKNNTVNSRIENTSLLTSPVKCTCQLCPTHAQMQNKNGIHFIFSSSCIIYLYKIIYNNCFSRNIF